MSIANLKLKLRNKFGVNWPMVKEAKYRVVLGLIIFCLFILGSQNVRYSITNSVGAHFFVQTSCPLWKEMSRWQVVEVPVPENDPHLPTVARHLIKKVGCLPGEGIIRRGIKYFCKTKQGNEIDLGDIKFVSLAGKKMVPWMYDPFKEIQEYNIGEDEAFLFGIPEPGSYDSRYLGPVKLERIERCLTGLL